MSRTVEDKFNLAANFIQSHHHLFKKSDLLQFYAFYKQSTVGELDTKTQSRPSFFKVQERTKYDAWNALGSMEEGKAMESYIELLTKLSPDWIDKVEDDKGSSGSFGGASVSRPKVEETIEDSDKSIEDFIREGNIEKLKELLSNIDPSELNTLDENGLGLIHWSADRGNPEVLKLVLNTKSINIDLQDSEGQTALFYASSCGHKDCIKLLLANGANKEIVDNEESSCRDVAYDDEIKKLFLS